MKKRLVSSLLAILMLSAISISAYATSAFPEKGTFTIRVRHGGNPITGGELTIYRVGKIVEEDGNYIFEPVNKLKDSGISLKDVDDPELAAELAELAVEKELFSQSAAIEDGEAFFENVKTGLYVVVQTEVSPGYAVMSPYLLSMPMYADGEYISDVVAKPKVPVEEEPDTPPPPPDEPVIPDVPDYPDEPDQPDKPVDPDRPAPPEELPKTGQLNWPVPLLSVSGLTLFLIGWVLCFHHKTDDYEN